MDTLGTATLAALLILVASLISVELALSAAILEIVLGVSAGSVLGLSTTPSIDFLAGFASVLLTFLAGAEVDPAVLRIKARQSIAIGGLSFLVPLVAAGLFTHFVAAGACGSRRSRAWRSRPPRLPSFTRSWWRLA